MKKLLYVLLSAILVSSVIVVYAPEAAPTPGAPYYQGKRIKIVVASSPGGGTDMCARVAAKFFSKYIPGNPQMVIYNQPGAGGQIAHKIFYNKTKPDGLTLLQGSTSAVRLQMKKGPEAIEYDLTKYKFIGNIVREQSVLLIKKGQKARLTDPSAKPIQVGTKAGEEVWLAMILWGKEFLGWNVEVVPGYGGSSELEMAFRRPGEVEMYASSNAYILNRMLEDGVAEIVCSIGKRSDFPGNPTFEEMLGDKKPTGIPWRAWKSWNGADLVDKFLAAPPGTPDDRVAILREAFTKMSQRPEFDELMKQRVSKSYAVHIGQETDDIMKGVLIVSQAVLDYIKELQRKAGIIAK